MTTLASLQREVRDLKKLVKPGNGMDVLAALGVVMRARPKGGGLSDEERATIAAGLRPGAGGSAKLVAFVRERAEQLGAVAK